MAGATCANNLFNAFVDASRVALLTPPMVVEPPEPPAGGKFESPIFTFTASNGRPSVSAQTMPIDVRVPTPKSCLAKFPSTEPSQGIVQVPELVFAAPPQVCIATPTPRLIGPAALSPRGCHFVFQSINSEAFASSCS